MKRALPLLALLLLAGCASEEPGDSTGEPSPVAAMLLDMLPLVVTAVLTLGVSLFTQSWAARRQRSRELEDRFLEHKRDLFVRVLRETRLAVDRKMSQDAILDLIAEVSLYDLGVTGVLVEIHDDLDRGMDASGSKGEYLAALAKEMRSSLKAPEPSGVRARRGHKPVTNGDPTPSNEDQPAPPPVQA